MRSAWVSEDITNETEFPYLHYQVKPAAGFAAHRRLMNAGPELSLPMGTAVYCCSRAMIFDLSRQTPAGTHILRTEVPLEWCEPRYREQLRWIVEEFRDTAAAQGFGV